MTEKKEELCDHCGGSIKIRLPVPKSGCDHLYYPENCAHCRSKRKRRDTNELLDEIKSIKEQVRVAEEALKDYASGVDESCWAQEALSKIKELRGEK